MPGADPHPRQVRSDEADEANDAASSDRRCRRQAGGNDDAGSDQPESEAESGGRFFTERERIQGA